MLNSNFGELKERIQDWTADDEDIVIEYNIILFYFSC